MTDVSAIADALDPPGVPRKSEAPQVPEVPEVFEVRWDAFVISTDPRRLDVPRLHDWLSNDAYWALGRPREKLERAVAHSLNFGVYRTAEGQPEEQVGYARVITDRATFAWLCDVYVDRSTRGTGVGSWLVETVRDHLTAFGLGRIMLATADAHGLYAKFGFAPLADPDQWMAHAPR